MRARGEASSGGTWGSADESRRSRVGLRTDRRAAVPLRIAPLVVIGLIFVVLAVLGATTL